jgi:hypothetical protein
MDNYRLIETVRGTDQGNARVQVVEPRRHSVRDQIKLTPDELDAFLRYEIPPSELDPLRPMGHFDSWAGNVKPKE